jgi:RNA polymerase sigma-70 factor (ECF subfamily)
VTQEVFLSIWEHPETFDPGRATGTFLERWRTAAVDVIRREEARRRRAARDAATIVPIPDVGELAMAIVTAEQVRAEVDRLPVEQREAIELAYFGGRTYRQVADELGIPEGTAKSRMRLGLARIAHALDAQESTSHGQRFGFRISSVRMRSAPASRRSNCDRGVHHDPPRQLRKPSA